MERPRGHVEWGLTLLEALLAAVLLAMAITAITMPFTAAAQNEQIDARRTLAVNLAQEMMEEVLSRPFADPQGGLALGPDPGETSRSLFDNIDDYDDYAETAGNIADFAGQIITEPAAAGLSRQVSAGYVYVSGQDTSEEPTFIRIVVEVQHDGASLVRLTRLVYAMQGLGEET